MQGREVFFRMLNIVLPYREKYRSANSRDIKNSMSHKVLDLIQDPTYQIPKKEQNSHEPIIRFMSPCNEDSSDSSKPPTGFYQVSYKIAHKKICHALRENKQAVLERQTEEEGIEESKGEGHAFKAATAAPITPTTSTKGGVRTSQPPSKKKIQERWKEHGWMIDGR